MHETLDLADLASLVAMDLGWLVWKDSGWLETVDLHLPE